MTPSSFSTRRFRWLLAVPVAAMALAIAACGGTGQSANTNQDPGTTGGPNPNAPEVNPAGDIPDNQAFVPYSPPHASYSVKVPEGWSRSVSSEGVTFTDKLNSITMRTRSATAPMTVQQARRTELPRIARATKGFNAGGVTKVDRTAGSAIRITYTATGRPDPVTGKAVTDDVERYIFFHAGKDLVLTLSGPKGADNVDPWRIVSDSVRWSG